MSEYTNPYVNYNIYNDAYSARANAFPEWGSQNPRGYGASEFPEWGSENIRGYGDSTGPFDEQRQGMNMGQAGNALAGGLAASQGQQGGYMPDQWAAFQGAAQGYAAGGVYGALAGAVVAPVTQTIKAHKNLDNLNTSVGSTTYDAYGRPNYAGAEVVNAMSKLPELDKTADWDSTNILGLGRKAKRKAKTIRAGVRQSQQGFNDADLAYRNRMTQLREYNERMSDQSQLYNLYRY